MIIFDNETTGLVKPDGVPMIQQPFITEFAAIKVDFKTLKEESRLTFFCKPPIPIPPETIKINGITDETVKGARSFTGHYLDLCEFFLGEVRMIAHNCPFDRAMLALELRRIDKLLNFPWPPTHLCSVELTRGITGRFMRQEALYEHYMGKPANQTHRAMDDVVQLLDIIRFMRKDGLV